jgi:hypothetical protein
LRFADDIILFAETEDKLKNFLEYLNRERKKDGKRMNQKKTKKMCNEIARRPGQGISIMGEHLEEIDQYKYLGRLLTLNNEQRITSGHHTA